MRSLIVIAALVFGALPSIAQDRLICIGEKATGFRWETGDWRVARFNVSPDRYLVEEIAPQTSVGKTYNYQVKRFGSDNVIFLCERLKFGERYHSDIFCGGFGWGMLINTQTLRYQETYALGYVDGKDESGNTPSITLGKCTKLN